MALEKLATLKQLMREAADFNDPWNYFFDHFGGDHEFMSSGEERNDEMLIAMIKGIGQQFFDSVDELDAMRLMAIPEYHFLHGGLMMGESLVTVIYFDDIDTGLFAVMSLSEMHVTLARFSKLQTEGDVTFVANDQTTLH